MNKRHLLLATLSAFAITNNAHALEVDGTITSSAIITNHSLALPGTPNSSKKEVYLMKVKMTPEQKQKIQNYHSSKFTAMKLAADNLPPKVDPGMNGVPVLDQGRHGTCVTFANTAAIDAMLGKGDYVSQVCNLEVGSYLAEKGYLGEAWNGTWGRVVLNQLLQFGIINKDNQKNKSCNGVTEYPTSDSRNTGKPMTIDDYKTMSEDLVAKGFYWQPMLDSYQRFDTELAEVYDGDKILKQVKHTIMTATKKAESPARVTFGVLLPVDYCSTGACARFHQTDDTWALTKAIENDQNPDLGGHEMVIVGYDDDAIAVDNEGIKHKGLLTLRNSWGESVGDNGNYYMTYDFFKKYVLEVQAIKIGQPNK